MRFPLIFAVMLIQVPAFADEPCAYGSPTPYEKLLSSDELEAVLANRPGSDIVLREAAAHMAGVSAPTPARHKKTPEEITDVQAERLIALGTIQEINMYHSGSVVLTSRSDRVYAVKHSSRDQLLKAVAAVDPCRIFIVVWLE